MEHLKPLSDILEADPRSAAFAKLNLEAGTTEPMVLKDVYGLITPIVLLSEVPDEIRSYMEEVKTLFVYGWFYYPFQTLAAFLSTTAVEMSLSMRLGKKQYEKGGFTTLLNEAKERGFLQGAHEAIAAMWARIEQSQAAPEDDSDTNPGPPVEVHFDAAWKSLIKLRNTFAHPKGHWIMSPGMALDLLRFSVEVINGLWTQSQRLPVEKAG
jgi:hypothetical protein